MARLLEDDAKKFLSDSGISVPLGRRISDPEEAGHFFQEASKPCVLKALVPIGGRGKAGGVRIVDNAKDATEEARKMLGAFLKGFPVNEILIEERLDVSQELYLSVINDSHARRPLVIVGSKGGVDIEQIYEDFPSSIASCSVDSSIGFQLFHARNLWLQLGFRGDLLVRLAATLYKIYLNYDKLDSTMLEVNPLVITGDGKVVAASCVLNVDDDALFRQPELESKVIQGLDRIWRPLTKREEEIVRADLEDPYRGTIRYTELDDNVQKEGNIAFVCGGGGASLVLQDAVRRYGGRPANYSEWGGNPTDKKIGTLVRIAASKPGVEGVLICLNISNNTRTDTAAVGIVRALRALNIDPSKFPVVIRLAGVNDTEARRVIEEAGFKYHGDDITLDDAARLIVELMERH